MSETEKTSENIDEVGNDIELSSRHPEEAGWR